MANPFVTKPSQESDWIGQSCAGIEQGGNPSEAVMRVGKIKAVRPVVSHDARSISKKQPSSVSGTAMKRMLAERALLEFELARREFRDFPSAGQDQSTKPSGRLLRRTFHGSAPRQHRLHLNGFPADQLMGRKSAIQFRGVDPADASQRQATRQKFRIRLPWQNGPFTNRIGSRSEIPSLCRIASVNRDQKSFNVHEVGGASSNVGQSARNRRRFCQLS